jgi:hypothetical protein
MLLTNNILYYHLTYDCPSPSITCLVCRRHILQGKVPILSVEAIHQLHIFIFVLAVTHVVLSAVTVILGITQVYMENVKLYMFKIHYQIPFSKCFVVHTFRQETGNIGRTRSSKTMIVVHTYILPTLAS